MGISIIKQAECIGCGNCANACPTDVIRMDDSGQAYVAYPIDCIVCYSCERDCPVDAIEVTPERPFNMPQPW
ncbi:ferredoxin family protein [Chloroflexota bacterium]